MSQKPVSNFEEADYSFKIVILGDPSVGKTSLVRRYVDNKFSLDYKMTIGMDLQTKTIFFGDKSIKLVIWDLAGQPHFQDVRATYCQGANAAILVFDLTRQETLTNLDGWIQTLWNSVGKMPHIIIGNKADLKNIRETSIEHALDFARFSGAHYFETSAKTGDSVNQIFLHLAETILKNL